ncbi:amidohydrolase family protein [Paenibacillus sp. YYML68]|uniref:amidohydrolase family protein n=1 Tax=Paenibacillus sp. YYML68 TaxID=2909250 RepID=UPI0024913D8D|nr:amidohydrolase family protein [Paenibacillus sp. YYML68]
MTDKLKIFDVDQHLCDLNICDWELNVPTHLQHKAPKNVVVNGVERLWIENKLYPKESGFGVGSPMGSKAGGNVTLEKRLSWMSTVGIDGAIFTPGNLGMAIHSIEDIELKHAVCQTYREWQLEQAVIGGSHCFAGILTDPFSLPTKSFLAHEQVCSLYMRPTNAQQIHMWEEPMHNVYKLACEMDLPIILHGGTGYYQNSPVSDQYDNYFYSHLFSHTVEMQMALSELIGHGIFREYKNLKIIFVEAGVSWVPSFVARLHHHMKRLGKYIPGKGVDVYETLYNNCMFSVFNEDAEGLGNFLIENHWMKAALGSDYPHWDTMNVMGILKDVHGEIRNKVAYQNAFDFLRIGAETVK